MEKGAWWATVHRVAELDTTEQLTLSFPLQPFPTLRSITPVKQVRKLRLNKVHYLTEMSWPIISSQNGKSTVQREWAELSHTRNGWWSRD